MIEFKDVSKVYAMGEVDVVAVNRLNFTVNRREFISIMGPSGSGKTTLLNLLGGLDTPTSGKYLLEGENISDLDDAELSRIRNKHFGFVFQSYNLFGELTAMENVMVPMIYAQTAKKDRYERAEKLLKKVELGHRLSHFPSQLSGGEQQRVAIARALANNPTLILADEPTGNVASHQGQEILNILCKLNEDGTTIIMVTHDIKVGSYGKRLLKLQDGKIASDEPILNRFVPLPQNMQVMESE